MVSFLRIATAGLAVRMTEGRTHGAEPRTVERAPSTAGAMASRTNDGRVQTTSGNDSRTGSRRAAASPARRRAALASSPRRSRTGASGRPSRTAVPSADTSGRALRPYCALSSTSASAKPAPRWRRRSVAWKPGRTGAGATRASSPIACGRRQAGVQAHDHQLDGVGHRLVDRLLRRVSPAAPAQQHDHDDGAADDDGDSWSESKDTADRKRRDGEDAPDVWRRRAPSAAQSVPVGRAPTGGAAAIRPGRSPSPRPAPRRSPDRSSRPSDDPAHPQRTERRSALLRASRPRHRQG